MILRRPDILAGTSQRSNTRHVSTGLAPGFTQALGMSRHITQHWYRTAVSKPRSARRLAKLPRAPSREYARCVGAARHQVLA
jgi:hypothetical protein